VKCGGVGGEKLALDALVLKRRTGWNARPVLKRHRLCCGSGGGGGAGRRVGRQGWVEKRVG